MTVDGAAFGSVFEFDFLHVWHKPRQNHRHFAHFIFFHSIPQKWKQKQFLLISLKQKYKKRLSLLCASFIFSVLC